MIEIIHSELWSEYLNVRTDCWEILNVDGIMIKDGSQSKGVKGTDWINLNQTRDQCLALVRTVMNGQVPYEVGILLD